MRSRKGNRGALTIEASIAYSIFLMIIVTFLYIIRIVYAHALVQHAVSQTAKELSMYSYIYQLSGLNEANQNIAGATSDRTAQLNEDVGNIVSLYEKLSGGSLNVGQQASDLTTNPEDILKNIASALVNQAAGEVNQQLFEAIAKPMIAGYIAQDSSIMGANERLQALWVVNGLDGLSLSGSSFFKDGATIDIVVCYTIDPLLPIDILPELNMMNRAYITGVSGKSMFEREIDSEKEAKGISVWDREDIGDGQRGKEIKAQEGIENLPSNFPTYDNFNPSTGKAVASTSMDLRNGSYQTRTGIRSRIVSSITSMNNYKTKTYGGVTLDADQIKSRELLIYIPASIEGRTIDRSLYDEVVAELQREYPDIKITTKEVK